ncbi:MAG: EamA family transporter, partial [Acidimicrobiia bacterium]
LSPTQTAVYINFNPLVATILAAVLLDEVIERSFMVGFGMVLAGVLLANLPRRSDLNRVTVS